MKQAQQGEETDQGRSDGAGDAVSKASQGLAVDLDLLADPSSQADSLTASAPAAPVPQRGILVEFVRLIMVSMFAVAGWEVASAISRERSSRVLLGTVLGSGVGFVLGGAFGRRTATAVSDLEREFGRLPASTILAGGLGLILGLALAALVSLPLLHLPATAGYSSVALAYFVLGFLGYRLGRAKSDELFGMFGVKPRAARSSPADIAVLDSSAILDGRVAALAQLGYLGRTLLVTKSVLDELRAVADSSDRVRRARGRRALDLLLILKRDPYVDVLLVDEEPRTGEDTDTRLVRLARSRGGVLVTNDSALGRVAMALDVPVRSIHALAEAMRPDVVPGDRLQLRLTRPGRAAGQAVGYLDDGTMVVVEEAERHLGEMVSISVTNAMQTSTGRMVFGRLAGDLNA
jgi:uncharacterized protein YacL